MSWRTHGFYKGLSKTARKWLRNFDRHWDTKAEGRSREDALDHMAEIGSPSMVRPLASRRRPKLSELAAPPPTADPGEEVDPLKLLAQEISRFTVPRQTRSGWSIHLTLKSGEKVRVRFADEETAAQAYRILQEASSILSAA